MKKILLILGFLIPTYLCAQDGFVKYFMESIGDITPMQGVWKMESKAYAFSRTQNSQEFISDLYICDKNSNECSLEESSLSHYTGAGFKSWAFRPCEEVRITHKEWNAPSSREPDRNQVFEYKLEELLFSPKEYSFGTAVYILTVYPDEKLKVQNLSQTEYGVSEQVLLKAEQKGDAYPDYAYIWEYKIDGDPNLYEYEKKGKEIQIRFEDLPSAEIGKNIYFRLKNYEYGDFEVFRFYPELPKLLAKKTQLIPYNEDCLTELKLYFDKPLNKSLNEKITLVSIYDSLVEQNIYGVPVNEIRLVGQIANLQIEEFTKENTLTISNLKEKGFFLKAGRYSVIVEGSVRGISTTAIKDGNWGLPALSAMPSLAEYKVVEMSEIHVKKQEIRLPYCVGEKGELYMEIFGSSTLAIPPIRYTFYKDGQLWTPSVYKKTEENSIDLHHYTFSEISVGAHDIRLVSNQNPPMEGSFIVDINSPSLMEISVEKVDIAGIQYRNGVPESSKNGWWSVNTEKTKNGISPYIYEYFKNGLLMGVLKGVVNAAVPAQYEIKLTDANACSRIFPISIEQKKDSIKVSLSGVHPICGNNNASLTASINSTVPYEISWRRNGILISGNTPFLSNLSSGKYQVRVKSQDERLISTDEFTLVQPTNLNVSGIVEPVSCKGEQGGAITLSVIGGKSPYTYYWDHGAFESELKKLKIGNYSVKVSDALGCFVEKDFIIQEPLLELDLREISFSNPYYRTAGELVLGNAEVKAIGGTPPYSYQWSNGEKGALLREAYPGAYTVITTDKNSCQRKKTILLDAVSAIDNSATYTMPTCHKAENGNILLNISGGKEPYCIEWSNGASGRSLSNLSAGVYTAMITDANGAISVYNMVVESPQDLRVYNVQIKPQSYYGMIQGEAKENEKDAEIRVQAEGGNPPYTYKWYKENEYGEEELYSQEDGILRGLTSGKYILRLCDANECAVAEYFDIPKIQPLKADINIKNPIRCKGESNAVLEANVSGGTPPYQYRWLQKEKPSWQIESLLCLNVGKGSYMLEVRDAKGVYSVFEKNLEDPLLFEIENKMISHPSYYGSKDGDPIPSKEDGLILINVKGGKSPYTYAWSHENYAQRGEDGMMMSDLKGGMYVVRIQDANTCELTDTAFLESYDPLVVSIEEVQEIRCSGGNEGVLMAHVSGGKAPYTYMWSGAAELPRTAQIENLKFSIYVISITDANGKESVRTKVLSQPFRLNAEILVQNPLCFSDSNGSMTALVSGGTSPYSYLWSDGSTNDRVVKLRSASLSLQVRDHKGCESLTGGNVFPPSLLFLRADTNLPSYNGTLYGQTPPAYSNGAISLYAGGGTPPYRFQWSDGDTHVMRSYLENGAYSVILQDANDCSVDRSFSLFSLPNLSTRIVEAKSLSCYGSSDARLYVQVKGGVPPYEFSWENEDRKSDTLDFVKAGVYKVKVKDKNGIISLDSIRVENPALLEITTYSDNLSGWGAKDGRIKWEVQGGTPPYHYFFDGVESVNNFTNLQAGFYLSQVEDSLGCRAEKFVEIKMPDSVTHEVIIRHCTYFGAADMQYYQGLQDGSIEIFVKGGVPPYTYRWQEEIPSDETKKGNLSSGIYTVDVRDKNAYGFRDTFYIEDTEALLVDIEELESIRCKGENTGLLRAFVKGGRPPYTFAWQDTRIDTLYRNASVGSYRVQVTDSKGVQSHRHFELLEPEKLQAFAQADSASGYTRNDGALRAWAQGGHPPYQYQWRENENLFYGAEWDAIYPGYYSLQIADKKGCLDSLKIQVPAPAQLKLEIEKRDCRYAGSTQMQADSTYQDGYIRIEASGGMPPYRYEWHDNISGNERENLSPGIYMIQVWDAYRNGYSQLIEIGRKIFLGVHVKEVHSISCRGDQKGSLNAQVIGGTPPYQYSWYRLQINDKDTLAFFMHKNAENISLNAGLYQVRVQDSLGVLAKYTYNLLEPDSLQSEVQIQDPLCYNENNGHIKVRAFGGNPPYTYVWRDGIYGEIRSSLSAALYQYSLIDAKGCIKIDSIRLDNPSALILHSEIESPTYTGNRGKDDGFVKEDASIKIYAEGGTPPYSYLWDTGDTLALPNIFSAGKYVVNVRDSLGCFLAREIEIPTVSPLQVHIENPISLRCMDDTNASLKVRIEGGIPPYKIQWNTREESDQIEKLSEGMYQVSVWDQNKVEARDTFLLYSISAPKFLYTIQEPSCHAEKDAAISVELENVASPYVLQWNTGAYTSSISNLAAGVYHLCVIDKEQCIYKDSILIPDKEALSLTFDIDEALCYSQKIALQISAKGGSAPYIFSWNNSRMKSQEPEYAQSFSDLDPGLYVLNLSDQNKCSLDTQWIFRSPPFPQMILPDTAVFCFEKSINMEAVLEYISLNEYSHSSSEWKEKYGDSVVFCWTFPDGEMQFGKEILSEQAGRHNVQFWEYGGCTYLDSTFVIASSDTIDSDFWISTQVQKGDIVWAVDVSLPAPDSLRWEVPQGVKILDLQGAYAELQFIDTGFFQITLHTYRNHCFETKQTWVKVSDVPSLSPFAENKNSSIFEKLILSPNPSMTEAVLSIILKKDTPLGYRVVNAESGRLVEDDILLLRAGQEYQRVFDAKLFPKGVYVIVLQSGKNIRTLKMIRR